MKSYIKKSVRLLTMFTIFWIAILFSVIAQAEVIVLPNASGMPNNVIQDIVKENPVDSKITFYSWNTVSDLKSAPQPRAGWNYGDIKISTTAHDVALGNYFIISVAKGATITLSKNWTKTVNTSVSLSSSNPDNVPIPTAGKLGIAASMTAEYSTSRRFSGPPESSVNNSREYRVKFYGDSGTWSAIAEWSINPAARIPISGTWKKPTSYAEYSVDSKQ